MADEIDEGVQDAVGEVLASFMGVNRAQGFDHLEQYQAERDGEIKQDDPNHIGTYDGCWAEAGSFIERLRARGYDIVLMVKAGSDNVFADLGLPDADKLKAAADEQIEMMPDGSQVIKLKKWMEMTLEEKMAASRMMVKAAVGKKE